VQGLLVFFIFYLKKTNRVIGSFFVPLRQGTGDGLPDDFVEKDVKFKFSVDKALCFTYIILIAFASKQMDPHLIKAMLLVGFSVFTLLCGDQIPGCLAAPKGLRAILCGS